MDQQETLTSNKLIAEFMPNMELIHFGNEKYCYRKIFGDKNNLLTKIYWFEQLNYHSSWESLMEVKEQIKKTGNVYELNTYWNDIDQKAICTISPNKTNTFSSIYITDKDELSAVYTAIVQFVKWYLHK